jgi:hypothetical protein
MGSKDAGNYTQLPYSLINEGESERNAQSVLNGLDNSLSEYWEKEEGGYLRNFNIAGGEYTSRVLVEVQENFVEVEHFLEPTEEEKSLFSGFFSGKKEGHFDYKENSNPCPEAYEDFPIPIEEVPRIKEEERRVLYNRLPTSTTAATATEGIAGFKARVSLDIPWGEQEGTGYNELNHLDSVINAVIRRDYQAIPWTEKL